MRFYNFTGIDNNSRKKNFNNLKQDSNRKNRPLHQGCVANDSEKEFVECLSF
jgi:hypothetical protein